MDGHIESVAPREDVGWMDVPIPTTAPHRRSRTLVVAVLVLLIALALGPVWWVLFADAAVY